MSRLPIENERLDQTWLEIEEAFRKSGMAEPAPGFSKRFAGRLRARRAAEERRQGLLVAVLWVGVAVLAALLLGWLVAPLLSNPVAMLSRLLHALWNLATALSALTAIITSMVQFLPDIVSPSLVYSLLALAVALGSWMYSALRDYAYERGVQL
jgi:hypothetical protein